MSQSEGDDEASVGSSEMYDRYTPSERGELRLLFESLKIKASLTEGEESPSSRLSSLHLEDPIHALNIGLLVLDEKKEETNDENADNNVTTTRTSRAKGTFLNVHQRLLAQLMTSLRSILRLGSSPHHEEMYEEMARAMLRCRIKVSNEGDTKNYLEDGLMESTSNSTTAAAENSDSSVSDVVSEVCQSLEGSHCLDSEERSDDNVSHSSIEEEDKKYDRCDMFKDYSDGEMRSGNDSEIMMERYNKSIRESPMKGDFLSSIIKDIHISSQRDDNPKSRRHKFSNVVKDIQLDDYQAKPSRFSTIDEIRIQDESRRSPPVKMMGDMNVKDGDIRTEVDAVPEEVVEVTEEEDGKPRKDQKNKTYLPPPPLNTNNYEEEDAECSGYPSPPEDTEEDNDFFSRNERDEESLRIRSFFKQYSRDSQDSENDGSNGSTPVCLKSFFEEEATQTPLPESPPSEEFPPQTQASVFSVPFTKPSFNVDLSRSNLTPTSRRRLALRKARRPRLPDAPYPPQQNNNSIDFPDVEMSESQSSPLNSFSSNVDDVIAKAVARAAFHLPEHQFKVDLSKSSKKTYRPMKRKPTRNVMDVEVTQKEDAKSQHISSLRGEGRIHYMNGDYRESVLSYTTAISLQSTQNNRDETLAILYGNRAAALMMLGAFRAAASDCQKALQNVASDKTPLLPEGGIALRAKLYCRMARAYLKAGMEDEAFQGFEQAKAISEAALNHFQNGDLGADSQGQAVKVLSQTITDGSLGKADVVRFKESMKSAASNVGSSRRNHNQTLIYLNNALAMSPGSVHLHIRKVELLSKMRRWSDLSMHCERMACESVKLDGVFTRDLRPLDPHPGTSPAKALTPNYFETEEEETVFSVSAVCDAVVRLPKGILPYYMRGLRLEERYSEAARAGTALEVLASTTGAKEGEHSFHWLSKERDKLRRTRTGKERGDLLFRCRDYKRAADKYAECLKVDGEGEQIEKGFDNSGGRLHAILHCNRAACLMAIEQNQDAIKECSNALKIQAQYMKAILRRARCHSRLDEYQEAMSDFQRWLKLVEEANKLNTNSSGVCWFDKASDIQKSEQDKVRKELADVRKAMKETIRKAQAEAENRAEKEKRYAKKYANDYVKASEAKSASARTKSRWDDNPHEWWKASNGRTTQKPANATASNTRRTHPYTSYSSHSTAKDGNTEQSTRRQSAKKNNTQDNNPPHILCPNTECHYKVLKCNMKSSSAEIKKSYHKLALKYHPDKNKDSQASDIFRRIQLAYEILSDSDSRKKYDTELRLKQFTYL